MEFNSTYDKPRDKDLGPTVLIVDDEKICREIVRSACADAIKTETLRVLECDSIPTARKILSEEEVHVVLLDKNLGLNEKDVNQNGIDAIPLLLTVQPHIQILMVTASDDQQDVVIAMRNGAFGYVVKGSSSDFLVEQIKNAMRCAFLTKENFRVKSNERAREQMELVGKSSSISFLRRQVETLAKTESPVALEGETGTGKTTVARMLHDLRQAYLKQIHHPFRAESSFVHINMAAMPEELIERELFGTEKGTYTGAVEAKPGLIEIAHGGTLFLDEIGDASPKLQAKLLTFLDSGEFRRLGGTQFKKAKTRVICATNKNLKKLIEAGSFREDLYYRLAVVTVRVPSLSERQEDIPEIVRSVLPKCCKHCSVFVSYDQLPEDFISYLTTAPICGNIRGIEQQVQQLLLFSPRDKNDRPLLKYWRQIPGLQIKAKTLPKIHGAITYEDVATQPFDIVSHPKFPGIIPFIQSVENKLLIEAHQKFEKSVDLAKAIGLTEGALSNKLRKLGLAPKQLREKSFIEKKSQTENTTEDQSHGEVIL